MGWQTYVFGCDSKDRLNKVMAAIEKHNILYFSDTKEDYERVGEALCQVSFSRQKKKYGSQDVLFVLCGHGGGRSSTYEFFDKEGVHVWPYNKAHLKRLEEIEYTFNPQSTNLWPTADTILEDVGIADVAPNYLREQIFNEMRKIELIQEAAKKFITLQDLGDIRFREMMLLDKPRERNGFYEVIFTRGEWKYRVRVKCNGYACDGVYPEALRMDVERDD
jgi:hypothetical protein